MLLAVSKLHFGIADPLDMSCGLHHFGGGNMSIEKVVVALLLVTAPALALATLRDSSNFVPEPETLALVAGAAVAWAIVRWKKRK